MSFDVGIQDINEQEVVIGLMGQKSREVLSGLSEENWNDFPFSTSRTVAIAGCQCRATRISFVGELGWELSIDAGSAVPLFEALSQTGAKPMGHYALDACRVEKGFYHWGHDLGPEITPLEAGLAWTIDWQKDFVGKPALLAQKETGPARRLSLFQIEGNPLVLHDEPILENRS